jgi:hypothetical protein
MDWNNFKPSTTFRCACSTISLRSGSDNDDKISPSLNSVFFLTVPQTWASHQCKE